MKDQMDLRLYLDLFSGYDKGQVRVIGYMSYELDDSPADACQPFQLAH